MDPHFNEYLAAIAGMTATYGAHGEDHPSEFHAPHDVAAADGGAMTVAG